MTIGIDVLCLGCGHEGAVNKVTAGLRCRCGSAELVYDDTQVHEAAAPVADFALYMTGKTAPVGTEIPGWNLYTGPPPSPNPMSNGVQQPITCPVCRGSRYDMADRTVCRECGGSGVVTPTTTPEPPAVARHNYPSTQTTVPFMGKRKMSGRPSTDALGSPEQHIRETTKGYGTAGDEDTRNWENSRSFRTWEPMKYEHSGSPLPLHGAQCPNCGKANTELRQDSNEDAWWHCPYCGPLTNVDRKPHVDPFDPPEDFTPSGKGFKSASRLRRSKKTGRLLDQIVLIGQTNPGLNVREVVTLARTALSRYPEAR